MKCTALLTLGLGFLFGILSFFFLYQIGLPEAVSLALLSAILFSLLLFVVLFLIQSRQKCRYDAFENEIASPIFFQGNGNFNTGINGIKNGRIYFCEDGIVCAFLSDKPYFFEEVPIGNIDRYYFHSTQLTIVTKDDRRFIITMSRIQELEQILKDHGWTV